MDECVSDPGRAGPNGNKPAAGLQRFGGYLAAMGVAPTSARSSAWGLITALFIPTGLAAGRDGLAKLGHRPIITYLLPVLIGYSGRQSWCTATAAAWSARSPTLGIAGSVPACRCSSAR